MNTSIILPSVIIASALTTLVFCVIRKTRYRESFVVIKETGDVCPPYFNESAEREDDVASLIVHGYNYITEPLIYRDGNKITPLRYSWDYREMAYYFDVAAPDGMGAHKWIIQTSDYVKPIIHVLDTDGDTKKAMVTLMRRREGYNVWSFS